MEKCVKAYKDASKAGDNIAVHCSGGEGRTGVVIGALLCSEAGFETSEVEGEVLAAAEDAGAKRKLSVSKVDKLLSKGSLA